MNYFTINKKTVIAIVYILFWETQFGDSAFVFDVLKERHATNGDKTKSDLSNEGNYGNSHSIHWRRWAFA